MLSLSAIIYGGILSSPSSSSDGVLSSSGIFRIGIWSWPAWSSDGISSSSAVFGVVIRSTSARYLSIGWNCDSSLVIFDVIKFPEQGLSSRVPALRPSYLPFPSLQVLFLCAYLWFRYALLTGSLDLNTCSVGDSCRLITFHFVMIDCNCFLPGAFQYSPFPGVPPVHPCTPAPEVFLSSPYKIFQACYLAAFRNFVRSVCGHAAE